jgi:hypothetical protein
MGNIVQLTAYKVGPSDKNLATPRIVALHEEDLTPDNEIIAKTKSGTYGSVIKNHRGSKKFEVFETALQIDTQINPSKAGADANTAVAAAGGTQAAAAVLTKYLNVVTSATAATADGVALGAATAGKVRRIVNSTAIGIKVYPATGENIDALVDDAAFVIPAGATYHFSCQTAGFWKSAKIS